MEQRQNKGKKPYHNKRNRSNSGNSQSDHGKKNFKYTRNFNSKNNNNSSNNNQGNNSNINRNHSIKSNKNNRKNNNHITNNRHYKNSHNHNYEASSSSYTNYAASSSSSTHNPSNSNILSSSTTSNNNNNNDNNNEPTILNIPGYYYDKEKKKYFKVQKNGLSTSEYSQSSVAQKAKEEKSKLQQDMEKLRIKNNNKNNNIRDFIVNREMGILTKTKNIEGYIYNKLFSNIKCRQTTRHREISNISLSQSSRVIALGHVNGYVSIKVRDIHNESSFFSCLKIANSNISSIDVFEDNSSTYHLFGTSLGGEAEPGTLNIYKYTLRYHDEEVFPELLLVKKVTYNNSTIHCCSISNSLESYITLADRFNALIHPNINSICSNIKHSTVSMPAKTDILIQNNTKNHLLYNGCRNGHIEVIDLQNLKLNTHKNFVKHSSSVCDIQQINNSLYISNSMNGEIFIWDVRGGTSSINDHTTNKKNPNHHWVIQELNGNHNEYLKNNIAVDSLRNIVITAGQDGQLRAWNMIHGEMIFSKRLPNYVNNTTTTIQLDYSDSLMGFWTANSVNLSLWNLRF